MSIKTLIAAVSIALFTTSASADYRGSSVGEIIVGTVIGGVIVNEIYRGQNVPPVVIAPPPVVYQYPQPVYQYPPVIYAPPPVVYSRPYYNQQDYNAYRLQRQAEAARHYHGHR